MPIPKMSKDGKVRTDMFYPAGFMDMVQIDKTKENFRLLYNTKGRFNLHKVAKEEASYKLCRVKRVTRGPRGVPYAQTHDGRTIRYPDPDIKALRSGGKSPLGQFRQANVGLLKYLPSFRLRPQVVRLRHPHVAMRYCNRRLSLLVLGLLLVLGILINLHRVADKRPPAAAAGTVARKQELDTVANLSQSESSESFQTEFTTQAAQTSEVPQAGVYQSRYQFTAATLPAFRPCEEKLLGLQKYRKLQDEHVSVCGDGASKILCAQYSEKQKVWSCQMYDVVEVLDPQGTLHWVAQCRMNKSIDLMDFLKPLHKKHPLKNSMQVRKKLDGGLDHVFTIVEDNVEGELVDHVAAALAKWKLQTKKAFREGLTYVSAGDCSTGNPGHCQADQQNLFIVQNLLETAIFDRDDTRVVLYNGFGKSVYADGQKDKSQDRPHLFEDWQSLSSEVIQYCPSTVKASFPDLCLREAAYVQRVKHVSTSPSGYTGPHWNKFGKDESCQGRSPLMVSYQIAALPWFESQWRQKPQRYADACSFLRQLAGQHNLELYNAEICRITATESNFFLWITRISSKICFKHPEQKGCEQRDVYNGDEMALQLSKVYSNVTLLFVSFGVIPYLDQIFLVRQADTIIAAHGGGSWNTARWLNSALEQMFGGQFTFVKIPCPKCKSRKNTFLKFDELLRALATRPPPLFNCTRPPFQPLAAWEAEAERLDLESGKILDHVKFEVGNMVMISGGNNIGRVGTITHREKHPGSFEIVHIKDAAGHSFNTRLENVFLIGSGNKPWISLPK
ncbi:RPS4, partial [Symbiodinium microadriaticum]